MSSGKWWAIFATLTTIEGVLLIKLLMTESLTQLLVAIGLIAALLVFTAQMQITNSSQENKEK